MDSVEGLDQRTFQNVHRSKNSLPFWWAGGRRRVARRTRVAPSSASCDAAALLLGLGLGLGPVYVRMPVIPHRSKGYPFRHECESRNYRM